MRRNHFLPWLALTFLAVALCPLAHAQSVADAARAAKEKKQKQSGAAPSSDAAPAKTKVITNDEIPEAHSDSQPASSKTGESSTPPKSGSSSNSNSGSGSSSASTGGQSAQNSFPHGPDSAHLDFKFTSSGLKRPAKAENLWMLKNTSDHTERIILKTTITGPCGYHYEKESASDFTSGQALTDNFDAELTVLSTDCAGTYRLELRASVAGKTLDSASDSITFE